MTAPLCVAAGTAVAVEVMVETKSVAYYMSSLTRTAWWAWVPRARGGRQAMQRAKAAERIAAGLYSGGFAVSALRGERTLGESVSNCSVVFVDVAGYYTRRRCATCRRR